MSIEETIQTIAGKLKTEYPEASDEHILFFLESPNAYLGGKQPCRLTDFERIKQLFERFLHPADVF